MADKLKAYHRELFDWHCRTFFRFDQQLTQAELDYLDVCFALATTFEERPASGQEHLSYYSYSHRISDGTVNSTRIAYGSMAHPARAKDAALPVIAEHGIAVDPFFVDSPHSVFGGLAWDVLANHFKIYFHLEQLESLPQAHLRSLAGGDDSRPLRPEGVVSFTYEGAELVEEKVYVYPSSPADLPKGSHHVALMRTSRRGEIAQYDVEDTSAWLERLSEPGRRLIRAYQSIREPLDTIAYIDSENYTLYFP